MDRCGEDGLSRCPSSIGDDGRAKGCLEFQTLLAWFPFPLFASLLERLGVYFPVFPSLNLHAINITSLFTEPPWVIISYEGSPVGFYPSVIGVAYMTSTEVALGLWFFHFLINLEMVVLYALGFPPGGYDHGGIRAITRGHEIGAFFALCGVLAWGIWQKRKMAVLTKGEKVFRSSP